MRSVMIICKYSDGTLFAYSHNYKFKMADKMAAKSCFYKNLRISAWIWVIFWENRSHCVKGTEFGSELH